MTPLVAFDGKEETKQFYVARVQGHYDADEIVKGIGVLWEGGRGSAVVCTLHRCRYEYYETELGIPQMLARVEDGIFDGLPCGDPRKVWPVRFLKAIRPGQDLSLVGWKFFHWLQTNDLETAKEKQGARRGHRCAEAMCGRSGSTHRGEARRSVGSEVRIKVGSKGREAGKGEE